jgi:hypothetical protein
MPNQSVKKTHGRSELKKFFLNGEIPSETHFEYLIDSTINKVDDGFTKDNNGFHVSPSGPEKTLITLYDHIDESTPFFHISYDDQDEPSLQFQPSRSSDDIRKNGNNGKPDDNSFYFHQGGRMGIGTKCAGQFGLQVKGYAGMEGRIGTYQSGYVPANGKWQDMPGLNNLNNCNAYEIIARTGWKGTGKFAVLHAIAICAYGPSGGKIRKTSTCYGWAWNKLSLRWTGDKYDYRLQIRTRRNYGKYDGVHDIPIYYHVTKLWEDDQFLDKDVLH